MKEMQTFLRNYLNKNKVLYEGFYSYRYFKARLHSENIYM
jgi:hypothetical protein